MLERDVPVMEEFTPVRLSRRHYNYAVRKLTERPEIQTDRVRLDEMLERQTPLFYKRVPDVSFDDFSA
jgi:hypothetical protein